MNLTDFFSGKLNTILTCLGVSSVLGTSCSAIYCGSKKMSEGGNFPIFKFVEMSTLSTIAISFILAPSFWSLHNNAKNVMTLEEIASILKEMKLVDPPKFDLSYSQSNFNETYLYNLPNSNLEIDEFSFSNLLY